MVLDLHLPCVCVGGGGSGFSHFADLKKKISKMSRSRPSPRLQSGPPVSCSGTSAEPEPNVAALHKIRPKNVLCLLLCSVSVSSSLCLHLSARLLPQSAQFTFQHLHHFLCPSPSCLPSPFPSLPLPPLFAPSSHSYLTKDILWVALVNSNQ